MTPQERGKLIWKLADLVEQNAERLSILDSIDSGKPINEMIFFDIPFTVDVLRYYAGWPTKITGTPSRSRTRPGSARSSTPTPSRSRSAWSARSCRGTCRC